MHESIKAAGLRGDEQTLTMADDWQSAFTEAEYDAIILGTGMKECLISGLLSVEGKKVRVEFSGFGARRAAAMKSAWHVP